MLRVLKVEGTLLITVPYGKFEDHGWLKNYDKHYWQNILDVASTYGKLHEYYFRHTFGEGWVCATPDELKYDGIAKTRYAACGNNRPELILGPKAPKLCRT